MRYVFGWDIIIVSIDAGAQEAIFIHFIRMWTLCGRWDRLCIWVELPIQKRLCPILVRGVESPDIHEYSTG